MAQSQCRLSYDVANAQEFKLNELKVKKSKESKYQRWLMCCMFLLTIRGDTLAPPA